MDSYDTVYSSYYSILGSISGEPHCVLHWADITCDLVFCPRKPRGVGGEHGSTQRGVLVQAGSPPASELPRGPCSTGRRPLRQEAHRSPRIAKGMKGVFTRR
ncbi:hypothetical protein NDU88_002778 [Pleurodeles waltl]|uniref:Uncharacterized protein n=1 Tax=Pleurodeles waltl TaxID=8319 RepID=A0AAV7TM55_PLEWA|nr:hypothetical protein NDU88_002778 [Pleurodeles waltl]